MYKTYKISPKKYGLEISFYTCRKKKMAILKKIISPFTNDFVPFVCNISGIDFNVEKALSSVETTDLTIKEENGNSDVWFISFGSSNLEKIIGFSDMFSEGCFALYLLKESNISFGDFHLDDLDNNSLMSISVHSDATYFEIKLNDELAETIDLFQLNDL